MATPSGTPPNAWPCSIGDTDAVIRLFGGVLATPHHHARLVQAPMEIEQYDDALAWARRGMDLPATWQSRPLFDLAAAIHTERGELADGLSVRERGLAGFPGQQSYAALREAEQRAGTWTDVRPRGLAVLAKQSARAHVEALVSDDDIYTAWAATHPTDAIPHYHRFAEEALAGATCIRVECPDAFAVDLTGLREAHRRRRAFLDELRRAGL